MHNRLYHRSAELMEAELGDEIVALDAQRGECFGFNDVATAVWRSLGTPKTFDQLRDELLAAYDVNDEQCSADLRELLDDFVARGLVAELPAGN